MVAIGVDGHKRVHQAVVLDATGRELGRWRGANTHRGWNDLLSWAISFDTKPCWGIEGAWGYGRGLAQHLVEQGQQVYGVNPRLTAQGRRGARRRGKSDTLDAQAVAGVVLCEKGCLPRVLAENETAVLELLVNERDSVLAEVTRLRNQIHHLLAHVDPE